MSRRYRKKAPIVVHDHDVLNGRGVNIAQHKGNQRFRTLVTTRADENYCTHYSASEKRAVAEDIIQHIKALKPPGRFLRREGGGKISRGLQGPWEELSEREVIKKTCTALRDCNRADRVGYAADVAIPEDVLEVVNQRAQSGLSVKQQAEVAVAASAAQSAQEAHAADPYFQAPLKRARDEPIDWGRVSPSVENAAEWLKKQRTDDAMATAAAAAAISDFPNGPASGYHHLRESAVAGTHQTNDDAMEAAAAAAAVSGFSTSGIYHDEMTGQQLVADAMISAATYSSGGTYFHEGNQQRDAAATAAAAAAVNDFHAGLYQDESTVAAANANVYSPSNLAEDEDLDVAEAAEVVASITESDDANLITPATQYPSLSPGEEALAREMAAAGGLMSAMNGPDATDGLYQHDTQGGGPGGFNLHNMNEL